MLILQFLHQFQYYILFLDFLAATLRIAARFRITTLLQTGQLFQLIRRYQRINHFIQPRPTGQDII